MYRTFKIFLLIIALALISAECVSAEVKGAWVSAWSAGYFSREEADATIAAAKSIGLNSLFIQVRKNADAFYNSAYEPRSANIARDFDPLAYIVEKAHSQGIKVHAWVNICRVWTTQPLPSDPNHLVNAHREWINKNSDGSIRANEGVYLDPGVPEARNYVVSVLKDIVTKYDVDGIHLDYIRYPGREWGYSDAALARYYSDTGATAKPDPKDPQWTQWRRDQVTAFVRQIRQGICSVNPHIMLSAATISWGDCPDNFCNGSSYAVVCQDWRKWLSDDLLDANVPMNYKVEKNAKNARQFRNWLKGFGNWSGGKPVYVGIDIHNNSASDVLQQIEAVRKSGLDGFVLFSFNASAKRNTLVRALGGTVQEKVAVAGEEQTFGSKNVSACDMFVKGTRQAATNCIGMARVYFKKAIELDPEYAEAYYQLGSCYLKERDKAKAIECFEKTLQLDPSHEKAQAALVACESED